MLLNSRGAAFIVYALAVLPETKKVPRQLAGHFYLLYYVTAVIAGGLPGSGRSKQS
jgi:hypothetical protein